MASLCWHYFCPCPPEVIPLRNENFIKLEGLKPQHELLLSWWMTALLLKLHAFPSVAIKRETRKSKYKFLLTWHKSAGQALAELKYIYQGLPLNQLASKREDRGGLQSSWQPSLTKEPAILESESSPCPHFFGHKNCWESGEMNHFIGEKKQTSCHLIH